VKKTKAVLVNPVQTRREEEKEQRRQAIIDAAEHVIAKHGWEDTNFGEIAKRSRLSRSLVYFYFPDREDLFHAVCDRGLTKMLRRFEAAVAKQDTGLEQIMAIGRAYLAFSQAEPLHFEILSRMQAQETDPATVSDTVKSADERGRSCLMLVAQALGAGLADGSIRKGIGDPGPTAIAVWAFTHGLIQISSQKEAMLKRDFQLSAAKTMEHGLALLRGSLAAG
jgi:AcrR family transcriptional regulator